MVGGRFGGLLKEKRIRKNLCYEIKEKRLNKIEGGFVTG